MAIKKSGRRRKRTTKTRGTDILKDGENFLRQLDSTIQSMSGLLGMLLNKKQGAEGAWFRPRQQQQRDINSEQRLVDAAYRHMGLKRGCGKARVKDKFRQIVKELRPDINTDPDTTKRYVALQTARDILLRMER